MKVVHLNTNESSGGAARAAHRLHSGLRDAECDSTMFVRSRDSDNPTVRAFEPPRDWGSRVRRRLRRAVLQRRFARYGSSRPDGLEPFSQARTQHGARVMQQLPGANIINLHWIRRFVDLPAFFDQVNVPVVWTLHDMDAFTGGCHYDQHCGRYEARCGACPQLGSSRERDLARSVWKRKKAAFGHVPSGRLHIVAPSRWLAEAASRSTLLGRFPVSVIPYGLDTGVFSPHEGQGVRTALGIPEGARVVLFVAASTTNERKGFSQLAEALASLDSGKPEQLYLISVGGNAPNWNVSLPCLHLGKITSDALLAAIYGVADVFVIPSLQDNLPNTVLESMACGTPVVGFDAGGIPDMVRPGETGWLAEAGDVGALRGALVKALRDDAKREQMGAKCRKIAVEEYALGVQARRYINLYEQMLSGHSVSLSSPKALSEKLA